MSSCIPPNNRVCGQNRGNGHQKDMRKIQKLSELQPTLAFSEYDIFKQYESSFHLSELGRLYRSIPFSELAASMGQWENRLGRRSYFSGAGKVALMVLKSYTGLSDRDLVAQLNSSIISFSAGCGSIR